MVVGKSVAAVAVAAEAMVQVFSVQMEKLYYASQRTKASVANIQALEFGFEQVGISGETARRSLEGMAAAIRMNPGMRGLMDRLVGHNTAGQDQAKSMLELVQALGKMPHAIGARFAQMFGMDEATFLMMVQKGPELEAAMARRNQLLAESGVDAKAAAEASREYMNSLRDLWERVTILGSAISVKLLPFFRDFVSLLKEKPDSSWGKQLDDIAASLKKVDSNVGVVDKAGDSFGYLARQMKNVLHIGLSMAGMWSALMAGDLKGAAAKAREALFGTGNAAAALAGEGKNSSGRTSSGKIGAEPVGQEPVVASAPNGNAMSREDKLAYLAKLEKMRGLPAGVLARMWKQESNEGANTYNPKSGAAGDFQFIPKTAAEYGLDKSSVYDFFASAQAAARKMQNLMKWSGGNLREAAGAYNFGEGNFTQYKLGQRALPSETRDYMDKVGGSVVLHQKTDIHIASAGSADATAAAVGREQSRVNADLVRNMEGAVR